MSARAMDWISNGLVLVGLGLLLAGVYLVRGLGETLIVGGLVLLIVGVLAAVVVNARRGVAP
jgi:membrane protein implicated in regulation of membrane protease activity